MKKYDPLKQIKNIEIKNIEVTDFHVFSPDNETNTSQCLSDRAGKHAVDHYQKDMVCTSELRWVDAYKEHKDDKVSHYIPRLQQKWVEVNLDYFEWLDVPRTVILK